MDDQKSFLNSLRDKWSKLQAVQKAIFIASSGGIITALFLYLLFSTSDNYVPLFSNERMEKMDVSEVISFLQGANVPYKLKGNNLILVPKDKLNRTRNELANYGLPRLPAGKGYELFDNNTWIKGEKELQMLELRALKGQLEQDISHFSNVRSANIIIDIPPPKPFGGTQAKTKASVILNLSPGTRLSQQELRAIANHVAGAVRGLTPNMVAISDTNGKLYQSIDTEGDFDSIHNAEIALEEHIKAKIDGMLATVVGYNNYFSTVQVAMNRNRITQERKIYSGTVEGVDLGSPVIESVVESNFQQNFPDINPKDLLLGKAPRAANDSNESKAQESKQLAVPMDYIKINSTPGKVESISIGVLIDQKSLMDLPAGQDKDSLKNDLQNQIETILKGYNVKVNQSVDFVAFDRTVSQPIIQEKIITVPAPTDYKDMILAILTGATAMGLLWLLISLFQPKKIAKAPPKPAPLDSLEKMLENIREESRQNSNLDREMLIKKILNSADSSQLGKFLYGYSPNTIAHVLTSLSPERAATILRQIPQDKQEEILSLLPTDFRILIEKT